MEHLCCKENYNDRQLDALCYKMERKQNKKYYHITAPLMCGCVQVDVSLFRKSCLALRISTIKKIKSIKFHQQSFLLTELGQGGQENIWLSVSTHGWSVLHDFKPNIALSGPPTQSISSYYPQIGSVEN